MAVKRGLGRGLNALIKEQPARAPDAEREAGGLLKVPVDKIRKNRLQPRQHFDPDALAALSDSIKARGILQPLLIKTVKNGYELIAGERRLRAAGQAGLTHVPAIIMDAEGSDAMELTLIENIQREDLNVIEEAEAYQLLARKFNLTQEEIAKRVGKARASVANAIRLLSLIPEVRQLVVDGDLSAGHAKILAGIDIPSEQISYARQVVRDQMSVRGLEKQVQKIKQPVKKPRAAKIDVPKEHIKHLSDLLHSHFGTGVRIRPSRTLANGKKAKGSIEIDFYSNEDLTRILDLLGITND